VSQRWKLVAIGILTVGATSLASTLTTAYLMRPPAATTAPTLDPEPVLAPEPRAPIVRVAPPRRPVTPPPRMAPIPPTGHWPENTPAPGRRSRAVLVDQGTRIPAVAIPPTVVSAVQVDDTASPMS
jgi:hypothetical protein